LSATLAVARSSFGRSRIGNQGTAVLITSGEDNVVSCEMTLAYQR
jgi:hypothetical protein